MEKILFIENLTDEKSSKVDHAIAIAEKKDLELSALFVIPVRQDVPNFPEVQAEQIEKAETKVSQFAENKAAELKDRGQPFAWKVVQSTATTFMEAMEAFTPVDIIMTGKIDLDPLSEKGIKTLTLLFSKSLTIYNCLKVDSTHKCTTPNLLTSTPVFSKNTS